MRSIDVATLAYERWMAARCQIDRADLAAKHAAMEADEFAFLRATFYRWAELFQTACADLTRAPRVLGVGDVHLENFGTWRDAEGRLVWGVNDFDEACPIPYTNDLVRLASSAWIASNADRLSLRSNAACSSILDGYKEGLAAGGSPFVLSERNRWLRDAVTSGFRDPAGYWGKFALLPDVERTPPQVMKLLREAMPQGAEEGFRVVHRRAGLGSLGRPRYTAIAQWKGGNVSREAKSILPSVWRFPQDRNVAERSYYREIADLAARAPDPFLDVRSDWLIRRISPYCSRIELRQLPRKRDEARLLFAMGWELANVHVGARGARARIGVDLDRRKAKWLSNAAEIMVDATHRDWKAWAKRSR